MGDDEAEKEPKLATDIAAIIIMLFMKYGKSAAFPQKPNPQAAIAMDPHCNEMQSEAKSEGKQIENPRIENENCKY